MFYKRISDLHKLGKPRGTDWSDIIESDVEYSFRLVSETPANAPSSSLNDKEAKPAPSTVETSFMPTLIESFNRTDWWKNRDGSMSYKHRTLSSHTSSTPSSEYFPEALWFEIAIAKDKDHKPTNKKEDIVEFQTKRLNSFEFSSNIREISAEVVNAKYMQVTSLNSESFDAKVINATETETNVISAIAGYFDRLNSESITAQAILSDKGQNSYIYGNDIFYENGFFTNVSTINFDAKNAKITNQISAETSLTATNAYFESLKSTSITSPEGHFTDITVSKFEANDANITNITSTYIESPSANVSDTLTLTNVSIQEGGNFYFNKLKAKNFTVNNNSIFDSVFIKQPCIAEYFIADADYAEGTVIKFGGSYDITAAGGYDWSLPESYRIGSQGWSQSQDEEIWPDTPGDRVGTYNNIPTWQDGTANGVIINPANAGMLLNTSISVPSGGYRKAVVLFGCATVRTWGDTSTSAGSHIRLTRTFCGYVPWRGNYDANAWTKQSGNPPNFNLKTQPRNYFEDSINRTVMGYAVDISNSDAGKFGPALGIVVDSSRNAFLEFNCLNYKLTSQINSSDTGT